MMLDNFTIDWTKASAISSIILACLTFIALVITLLTLRLTTIPKGKLMFRTDNTVSVPQYQIRFHNERNVPIMIIHKGIFIKKDKRNFVLYGDGNKVKLEWADLDYYSINQSIINQSLVANGYSEGSEIILYGYVKTGSNKVYKNKIKHVVKNTELKLKLKENQGA